MPSDQAPELMEEKQREVAQGQSGMQDGGGWPRHLWLGQGAQAPRGCRTDVDEVGAGEKQRGGGTHRWKGDCEEAQGSLGWRAPSPAGPGPNSALAILHLSS